jgi:hypothetical protein
MLTEVPLLSYPECEGVAAGVRRLRELWIPRGIVPSSFYTLGLASYQDLSRPVPGYGRRDYYGELASRNSAILAEFTWLFARLQEALTIYLGAPTYFSRRCAVPGFHIFEAPAIPTGDVASIHFDLQYQLLDWHDDDPPPNFDNPLSFTLPIQLPAAGGGLNLWEPTYHEVSNGPHQDLIAYAREHRPTVRHYRPGALVVHSGHRLHQIAGVSPVEPTDTRLTLQGHAMQRGERWILYW